MNRDDEMLPRQPKKTEWVGVRMDEEMLLQVSRLAVKQDRKVSEMLRLIVKNYLAGHALNDEAADDES